MQACWCGNKTLNRFSNDYRLCESCQTLVSTTLTQPTAVTNDENDFYGKQYWLQHQSDNLGQATIYERARSDLSERCLFWLRTLLQYKLPPANSLEIGCAHGGFSSLLQLGGYHVTGLELSPFIADFARNTFNIPVDVGLVETQSYLPASHDIIILMDVLEHLPDPVATLSRCFSLLKEDGILVIQTPSFPTEETFSSLQQKQNPFLKMLQPQEHLFLFSPVALTQLISTIGNAQCYFEPAIFPYDMFCFISRQPLTKLTEEAIQAYLASQHQTRYLQTMLDLAAQRDRYIKLYQEADQDRVARLAIIHELEKWKRHDSPIDYIPVI